MFRFLSFHDRESFLLPRHLTLVDTLLVYVGNLTYLTQVKIVGLLEFALYNSLVLLHLLLTTGDLLVVSGLTVDVKSNLTISLIHNKHLGECRSFPSFSSYILR